MYCSRGADITKKIEARCRIARSEILRSSGYQTRRTANTKFRSPVQGLWLLSCHHVIDGVARAASVETTRFMRLVLAHLWSRYYTVIFACSRTQRRVTGRADSSERFMAPWTATRMVEAGSQKHVSVTASRRITRPRQARRLPPCRRTSSRVLAHSM
jgi:hypothetical protein